MAGDIVVGVTDAAATRRAVDWAAERAAAVGSTLVLVAVDDTNRTPDQTLLDAERTRLEHAHPSLKTQAKAVHGDVVVELVEASEGADLLVIGDTEPGRHRGDHGRRIASDARCPVAVIPDIDSTSRAGVVVGVDGSDVTARAIEFAAAEAARRSEPLIAVAAWLPAPLNDPSGFSSLGYAEYGTLDLSEPADALLTEALAPALEAHPGLVVDRRVVEGEPASILAEIATDAALLVVGTHGRGPLARFFVGSVSRTLLTTPPTPTLAIR